MDEPKAGLEMKRRKQSDRVEMIVVLIVRITGSLQCRRQIPTAARKIGCSAGRIIHRSHANDLFIVAPCKSPNIGL